MEPLNTLRTHKIPFYRQRTFGDKMNASFDFLKENWKVVLKYVTYLLLPLSLLQGLSINSFMDVVLSDTYNGGTGFDYGDINFLRGYVGFIFLASIGSWLLTSVVYALVRLYNDREDGLNGITFSDLQPYLFRNIGRLFMMGLLLTLVGVVSLFVLGLLVYITPYTLFLTIPALFVFFFALSMCIPTSLFEDEGVGAAFSNGIRRGFATWGGMFAILFVMGLVASVIQGVTTMPWYITTMVNAVFSYSSGEEMGEFPFYTKFFNYLLAVLQAYGNYLAAVLPMLGLSYHYAHTAEKVDAVTVEDDIENFENL